MTWDVILYLSLMGIAATAGLVMLATTMGIRYRRELPKLPIVRSIEALEEERRWTEEELADLQDRLREARNTIADGEEWKVWLADKTEEIERIKRELQTLEIENERLEKLRSEIEAAEGTRDELTAATRELDRKREALEDAVGRLDEACRKRADLAAELPQIRESVDQLRREQETLERQLPPLRESLGSKREEIVKLREEKAGLDLTIGRLQAEQERLLKWIEKLQEAYRKLQEAYRKSGGGEGHDSCEDLRAPWLEVRSEPERSVDESDRLHHLSRQLDQIGVRFPLRTLHAFHTALKVQDLSPLTVLAGISGTGKSLLPAVYARGMGLHFLNLPVQPSWNSPQDLFGFYNYLEHKYKATPLARALLQFTQWDRPTKVEPVLDDQMLLVLLDEMNLARVEYYFSELLSRLELRRTIDPEDGEARRSVSVPLEIPRMAIEQEQQDRAMEESALHLYPSENILFTGTMNEDESTLSLSDKVLDRATVLRFGRPRKLATQPPRVASLAPAPPLAFEVWRGWADTKEKELPAEFAELIRKDLAAILARLGTPLTHRAVQGIHRYLLLHPEGGNRGLRHALADQIEQRVLPRVRGHEIEAIHDPMNELARLLEDRLDDAALAEAIKAALVDEQGVFLWTGLDRTED